VFENLSALATSASGRAGFCLEALEDRTTPAVVSTAANSFGSLAFDASGLNGVTLSSAAGVDRAFLAEVGRTSVMQWFLGTTVANQGSDPQIRAFGRQLADSQLALFNQVLPVLNRSGGAIQLTAIDQQLVNSLPTLGGAALDAQFLFFSSLYGLQASGAARTEALFGTNAGARTFAQSQVSPIQSQLQLTSGFLGPDASAATLNMFSAMGGFGPFSSTGLGTTGFGTTGFGTVGVSPVSTGFGTTGFGTRGGFGTAGTFGTSGFDSSANLVSNAGFGPGASFGSSTGFGPANTTTGFSNTGFGPGATFGTPGSIGMSGTGSPIF